MSRQWLTGGTFVVGRIARRPASAYAQGHNGTAPVSTRRSASSQMGQSDVQSTQFVEKMLMANMAEVQAGAIGRRYRATRPRGQIPLRRRWSTDHTQANQELLPLAQQLGVEAAEDARRQAPCAFCKTREAERWPSSTAST